MIDFIQMMKNLAHSMPAVEDLVLYILKILGLSLLISGVLGLMHVSQPMHGDSGQRKEAIMKILAGIGLFCLNDYVIPILVSTFYGSYNAIDFNFSGANVDVFFAVKIIVQLLGIIWIGLGIQFLIREEHGHRAKSFKGFTYLISGILALNFEYAAKVINYLFHLVMQLFK